MEANDTKLPFTRKSRVPHVATHMQRHNGTGHCVEALGILVFARLKLAVIY